MCIRAERGTFVCLHADAVTALKADLLLPFPSSGGQRESKLLCLLLVSQASEPHRERRGRSMTAMEKEQRRHLLMIQRTGPHHGEKVRMSHFPPSVYHFITWTL